MPGAGRLLHFPFTPPPAGGGGGSISGTAIWTLEGDENFSTTGYTTEQKEWFDRSVYNLPGEYGGTGPIADRIRTQGVTGPNPTYTFAREGGEIIAGLAMGLRATGYLGYLDGICDILDALKDRLLPGPLVNDRYSTGKYAFRYFPGNSAKADGTVLYDDSPDTVKILDDCILHGFMALGVHACEVNRNKLSPAASLAAIQYDYGAIADFWKVYLDEDLPHKWWSGDADGTQWNYSFGSGSWVSGDNSKRAIDEGWPWLWRPYRHTIWPMNLYYLSMYEMTGKAVYKEWRDNWLNQMLNNIHEDATDLLYAWTWGATEGTNTYGSGPPYGGSSHDYLIPMTYLNYVVESMAHFWAEGLLDNALMAKLTGHLWKWTPVNGYLAMENDSTEIFGNSMGGGTGNGDVERAGIVNNDIRSTMSQQNVANRNYFVAATLFHPEARDLGRWVYANVYGTTMTPQHNRLPIAMLCGLLAP